MEAALNVYVDISPDLETLSQKAASLFAELSQKTVLRKGRFSVALSGGFTPRRFFELLSERYRDSIEWSHVDIFWADERCVPQYHEESNYGTAKRLLLSKVPLLQENIFRVRGEDDPSTEAVRYEEELSRYFGRYGRTCLDLIVLGMGSDGHTASLFPGEQSMAETIKLVIPVYVEKLKEWRVTMTLPLLNRAREIFFLVSGRAKAEVLAEILEHDEKRRKYPAGFVDPSPGEVVWLIDKDASLKLQGKN